MDATEPSPRDMMHMHHMTQTWVLLHIHEYRYRRPARRGVGLELAGKSPDSRACTVGTTWRSPELSVAQASVPSAPTKRS
jgi:hypothetical protein